MPNTWTFVLSLSNGKLNKTYVPTMAHTEYNSDFLDVSW